MTFEQRAAELSPAAQDLRRAPLFDRLRAGWWNSARFQALFWLGVGSVKVALSRPGRALGWCPIPPRRIDWRSRVEITSGY